jgi:vitamin B12 transporter
MMPCGMGRPRYRLEFLETGPIVWGEGRQSQETGGVSILICTPNAYLSGQPSTPAREGEEEKMRLRLLPAVLAEILFGIFLAIPAVTSAQAVATINGILSDPSGAAVAGAQINAVTLDTSRKTTKTQSAMDGKFVLVVSPGRFRLSVRHLSFAPVEQEFELAAGETRTWDVRLPLEPLSSKVVVSATAEPEPAVTVPVPVDIITRRDAEQRQEIWLAAMLTTAQGVSLGRTGAYGGATSIFLDGGNSNFTKVLVDGTPVNVPGGGIDFSNFTLENVDKIEIVHGASSALYGSDAMTGVLQIFTHRGTTRTPRLTLEGDGGTFRTGHGGAQLSAVAGAFDYSAAASYFSTNGQGVNDAFHNTTLSGNFGWRFSNTNTLRATVRSDASIAELPGQPSLGAPTPGASNDLNDVSANLRWDFSAGEHWQNHLIGYESRNQDLSISSFGPFLAKFNRAGLDEQAAYRFRNGSLTTGYMFEEETGPAPTRHNQAGYMEARYQFGKRLTAIAGGRAEANGAFGTRVVPRLGASYALREGKDFWGATRLHASYGLGIKEPEMLPAGCGPDLKPERSNTFNAGVDQYFGADRAHLSVTYFRNDFRDIVSFAFVSPMAMPPPNCGLFGGSFFNTDKAWAHGGSVSFEAKAMRWLRVAGNYTYDDTRVVKAGPMVTDPAMIVGSRLFRRPLHSANIVANAHFRRMNWNLAGNYVGRRTDSDFISTFINGVCQPGPGSPCITSNPSYVRWDLANSIDLGDGFSTLARVENLFNNHYQDTVGFPALRLNWRLGLRYAWGRE